MDILEKLSSPYAPNLKTDEIYENLEVAIKNILMDNDVREKSPTSNFYSLTSNYIKMMIDDKKANANFLLSMVIKYTSNYMGLYLIGMLIRHGANPNVYFDARGYGNIHVICFTSLRRVSREQDPWALQTMHLLKMLGSDIFQPAYQYRDHDMHDLDTGFVRQVVDKSVENNELLEEGPSQKLVKDFVMTQGFEITENSLEWLDYKSEDTVINMLVASDNLKLFKNLINREAFDQVVRQNIEASTDFLIRLSTASAMNIASELNKENFVYIEDLINAQPLPLFAATTSCDKEMFNLFIRRGSLIKYPVINNIVVYFKWLTNSKIKLAKNNYYMLLDAVNIGADIDLVQFELFNTAANYEEVEEIKKAFQVPKWKKLCSVQMTETRIELKQIAFDLNLNFNMSEEQICSKLKHISLLSKEDFLESAIKRQEDRISNTLSSTTDYVGKDGGPERYKCSEKCTVITNPYIYNDARMAFYKDPRDGEVWCFTSDTFENLLASETNPYTNKPLPNNFIQTLKAQVNILKELAVFNNNKNIKDALREYFDRTVMNNRKTEYAYNTVVKILSLYGLSEERFNETSAITLKDTVLESICDVKVSHFEVMNRRHQLMFTARILYSFLKNDVEQADDLAKNVAESLGSTMFMANEEGQEEDSENIDYATLLNE